MLETFTGAIAPIFAIVFVGYGMRARGLFDAAGAAAINRYVFFIAVPALLFSLVTTTPLAAFDWRALGAYLAVEAAVYALGYVVGRHLFKRGVVESMLFGMAAALSNHVFLVLPIGEILFGDAAAQPITAILLMDSVILFACSIVLVDLATSGSVSLKRVGASLVGNPPIVALALGVALALSSAPIPTGVGRFAEFVGASAAPASLFALGVILADRAPFAEIAAPLSVSALKLVAAPALTFLVFGATTGVSDDVAKATLLVAAGPCGAMPFVVGLRFGAPVATISRAILFSTALSALGLSALAAAL